jgi:hypothetical protein
MARVVARSSGWTTASASSELGWPATRGRPVRTNMRWDQVRTPVSRSLSQSAVAVSSSAAASRVRLIATVSRASSRSVTSIVAPVTLAT